MSKNKSIKSYTELFRSAISKDSAPEKDDALSIVFVVR